MKGLGTQFALMSRALSRQCSYVSNPQLNPPAQPRPDVHHAWATYASLLALTPTASNSVAQNIVAPMPCFAVTRFATMLGASVASISL